MARDKTLGRLLKAGIGSIAICEGKTSPVVEEEIGHHIGLAGSAIQLSQEALDTLKHVHFRTDHRLHTEIKAFLSTLESPASTDMSASHT